MNKTYTCIVCGKTKTATYPPSKKSRYLYCSVKCNNSTQSERMKNRGKKNLEKIQKTGKKICSECKKKRLIKFFYVNKHNPNGFASACKKCVRKHRNNFAKTEKYKKWFKKFTNTQKYKDKTKKFQSEYRKSLKGKEWWKKYRKKRKFIKYRRQYEKEYYKLKIPKEKRKLKWNKYRCLKLSSADGTVNYETTMNLLNKQNNCCKQCGVSFARKKKHLDHIIPVSKGGKHTIKNLQWLCYLCNIRKSNKMPEDYKKGIRRSRIIS